MTNNAKFILMEKILHKIYSTFSRNASYLLLNELRTFLAQSAGAVEYTDCNSAEG